MKSLVCAVLVLAVVSAEPPLHRLARFRSARQELASDKEPTTSKSDLPYPAAGYRPDKEFSLPNQEPAISYGVPDNSYGAPVLVYTVPNEYGAPRTDIVEDTSAEDSKESEEGSGEEDKESKEDDDARAKLQNDNAQVASGSYYVLLPDNRLQLVQFTTQNDVDNMAYTARLQYRNEDRAPIYVYTAVPQYTNGAYVQWVR